MSDPIVGIDLGTSNSVVAHAEGGGPVKVLADDGGYKIHPSVVSFHPNGGVVVGSAAKQRKVIDPGNTIYSVKRLIGRSFRSPEVQTAQSRVPFQIKEGANQMPMIATRGGEFAVPEISAIVLDYVRNIASARLETPVQRAVVTVPASFNDAQRSATATAGAIAGLTVVRVLNEPTAAALAYGNTRNLNDIIAVYDFGGGTFDISILKLDNQVYEVLGTSGDTFLGGDDLDERLVDKMVAKFLAENRIDLRTNEVSMMRLRAVAEQTKIELSRRSRAVVRIDEIAYGPRGVPLNLQIEITRDEFVGQVSDIIDRTFPVCQEALTIAGIGLDKISDVIMVGGTTKIPYVRDQVGKFFQRAPRTDVNPEDAVAVGAALQAASLEQILARPRTSTRIPVVDQAAFAAAAAATSQPLSPFDQPTEISLDEVDTGTHTDMVDLTVDEASGAVMAPSELSLAPPPTRVRQATAGYEQVARTRTAEHRPDTSYSITRGQAKAQAPIAFDELTPPPVATPIMPLGRMTRPIQTPPPIPVLPSKTLFGVPEGPNPGALDLGTDGGLDPAIPPPLPAKLPTMRNPQIQRPPSIPSRPTTTGITAVAPPPSIPAIPAGPPGPAFPPLSPSTTLDIPGLDPAVTAPGMGLESTTQPAMPAARRAPPSPISWTDAGPPAAPPRSPPIAPPSAPTLLEMAPPPPPATTARGFAAPMPVVMPSVILDDEFAEDPPSRPAPPMQYAPQTYPVIAQPAPPPVYAPPPPVYAPPPPLAPPVAPPVMRPPPTLIDVTPRGLGIATVAGYCEELIRRNARVPAEVKRVFITSRDRQDVVRIVVCQGESRRLDANVVLGDIVLAGLQPRPRGETQIEVTFSLDASGILQVRARDANTGAEQRASLDLVGDMSQQDVDASRDRLQQLRR